MPTPLLILKHFCWHACFSFRLFVSFLCLDPRVITGTIRHHGTFERYNRAEGILIIMIPGVRYTLTPSRDHVHHSTFSYYLLSVFLCSPRLYRVLLLSILLGRGFVNIEALHVRRFCIWFPPADCCGKGTILSGNRRCRLTSSRGGYQKLSSLQVTDCRMDRGYSTLVLLSRP
jgi:hypothetical protein